jgi:hypothetical protein
MDATRQLPQIVQSVVELGPDASEFLLDLLLWGDRRGGGAQPQGQRDQPLLGAVVQVALDPPACLVGGNTADQLRDVLGRPGTRGRPGSDAAILVLVGWYALAAAGYVGFLRRRGHTLPLQEVSR